MTSRYDVRWSDQARKQHERFGPAYKDRFRRMVVALEQEPHHHAKAIKRLSGALAGLYRFRIGKLRVFFTVSEIERAVYITNIDTRGDAY